MCRSHNLLIRLQKMSYDESMSVIVAHFTSHPSIRFILFHSFILSFDVLISFLYFCYYYHYVTHPTGIAPPSILHITKRWWLAHKLCAFTLPLSLLLLVSLVSCAKFDEHVLSCSAKFFKIWKWFQYQFSPPSLSLSFLLPLILLNKVRQNLLGNYISQVLIKWRSSFSVPRWKWFEYANEPFEQTVCDVQFIMSCNVCYLSRSEAF